MDMNESMRGGGRHCYIGRGWFKVWEGMRACLGLSPGPSGLRLDASLHMSGFFFFRAFEMSHKAESMSGC